MGNSGTGQYGEGRQIHDPSFELPPALAEYGRAAAQAVLAAWASGRAHSPAPKQLARLSTRGAAGRPFEGSCGDRLFRPPERRRIERLARELDAEPADIIVLCARRPSERELRRRLALASSLHHDLVRGINRLLRPTGRRLSETQRAHLRTHLVAELARLPATSREDRPYEFDWQRTCSAWASTPTARRLVEAAVAALVQPHRWRASSPSPLPLSTP